LRTIEVDFDVFKAITLRRPTEDVTENDVLRELLGLPPKRDVGATTRGPAAGDWIVKGVRFPAGTEFRANYKGQLYLGRVDNGALVLNGQPYDTPSAAAMAITGNPVNGWTFWECRLPGLANWQIIKGLRRGKPSK
jgi:hypothetical protein